MRPPLTLKALAGRRNTILFSLSLAAAACLAGWMVYSANYLRRLHAGPESMTLAAVAALGDAAEGRWFKITADQPARHLLQTTTRRRRGGTSVTNHFVHFLGRQSVLVETSSSGLYREYYAWASAMPTDGSLYQRAKSQLGVWGAGSSTLSPMLLTTSAVPQTAWNTTIGILSVLALAILGALWWTGRQAVDYLKSSPIARLKKSVRASEGISHLVGEIDQQLAKRDPSSPRQGLLLTPDWLLNVSQNGFSIMSADDVVYIAPYTMTNQKWFKKTEQSLVRVVDRTGMAVEFNTVEGHTLDLLRTLNAWAPWAVIGNEPAMEARFGKINGGWKRFFKSTPSKKDLIAQVEEKRQAIKRQWATAQAEAASPQSHPSSASARRETIVTQTKASSAA